MLINKSFSHCLMKKNNVSKQFCIFKYSDLVSQQCIYFVFFMPVAMQVNDFFALCACFLNPILTRKFQDQFFSSCICLWEIFFHLNPAQASIMRISGVLVGNVPPPRPAKGGSDPTQGGQTPKKCRGFPFAVWPENFSFIL